MGKDVGSDPDAERFEGACRPETADRSTDELQIGREDPDPGLSQVEQLAGRPARLAPGHQRNVGYQGGEIVDGNGVLDPEQAGLDRRLKLRAAARPQPP